jgi:hypothetical protein
MDPPAFGKRRYCLEDIDVDALNDTSPAKGHPVGFQLPDYVVEHRLLEEEKRHYETQYDYDADNEVPF